MQMIGNKPPPDEKSFANALESAAPVSVHLSDKLLIHTIMNNSQDTIYFKDRDSKFVLNSMAHARQFDLDDPRKLIGMSDADFFPEDFALRALLDEQEIMRTGQPLIGQIEKWDLPDGRAVWFSASKYPMYDENGQIVGTWGTSRNITELKLAEAKLALANAKLETLSRMDELSGLYNRRYFYEMMKNAARQVQHAKKLGQEDSFCLIILDIDRFKAVNDTHGHLRGDDAIRHIAELLTKHSRPDDMVFRIGGDEYAILLPETDLPTAKAHAEYLRKTVENTPLSLPHERQVELTVSMGVACYCDHWDTRKTIHDADMRLYQSKNTGRNLVN